MFFNNGNRGYIEPLNLIRLITSPELTKVPLWHPVTLQKVIALLKSNLGVNPIMTISASGLHLQFTSFANITPH